MNLTRKCIVLLLMAASPFASYAQGCSDAGFCTVQSIKTAEMPDTAKNLRNTVDVGFIYGLSKYDVQVVTTFVEYTYNISDKVSFTARLLAGQRTGELAAVPAGLSDVILTMGYAFTDRMKFIGGFKFPLDDANYKKDGQSLPMAYQNSLGTFDMIMGLSYSVKRWAIIGGLQVPITQNNNGFLASDYPVDDPAYKYNSTYNYVRAGDVLLRVSYTPVDSRRIRLITGVLPILHLFNDTYTDRDDVEHEITGSQGLTLNITAILQWKVTKNQVLEVTTGAPALSRKERPDGLSKFGIGLEYKIRF